MSIIRERSILFSAPMVKTILDGRKTMTRRIINPQPVVGEKGCTTWKDITLSASAFKHYAPSKMVKFCPYGVPGNRLWVRETCRALETKEGLDGIYYPATNHFRPIENTPEASEEWRVLNGYRKKEGDLVRSIHMPRWASRILLDIVSVRVERLQDITEEDAIAEGSQEPTLTPIVGACWSERDVFAKLWDHIHRKDGYEWDANPWVWVIDFKRIEP